MTTFAERMKMIRERYELTQADFAERLNIDPSYLSYIENGKKHPSNKIISKLYRDFKINTEWLETGQGDMILGEPPVITPVKRRRVLADLDLLEAITVGLEESIAKKRHSYTPAQKGKLMVACFKYFNDVDEKITPKEIMKEVHSIYDVLARVING